MFNLVCVCVCVCVWVGERFQPFFVVKLHNVRICMCCLPSLSSGTLSVCLSNHCCLARTQNRQTCRLQKQLKFNTIRNTITCSAVGSCSIAINNIGLLENAMTILHTQQLHCLHEFWCPMSFPKSALLLGHSKTFLH